MVKWRETDLTKTNGKAQMYSQLKDRQTIQNYEANSMAKHWTLYLFRRDTGLPHVHTALGDES